MRYKNYREVDLPWLDKIPEHWKILSLRNILEERNEKNSNLKNNNILSVMKDIGVILYKDKGNVGNKASEDISRYKIVKPGDLVLNSMNVIIGSVGLSKYNGVLSPVYYVLTNLNESKYSMQYIEKIFIDRNFQQHLKIYGKGILDHRLRIPMGSLKAVGFTVPPKEEQEQIARFLDWKINEIDRLILYKKESIEKNKKIWDIYLKKTLLKENETIKLKYISHVIPGKEIKEEVEYRENAVPVYGSSDTPFKYTTESLLDGKYIIFGRKGTIGKPYRLNGKFWIIDTAYAVKNNDLVEFDFLYYLFNVINWSKFTTQTALPSIVANEVIQEKVYFPSKKIQKDISEKLKDIEVKIENTNTSIKTQIEKLKLLKESLISDVVTGKIDVRNVEIPDYEEVKIEGIEELEEEVSYGD